MTRKEFMELMALDEDNMEDLELDERHENGETWFEIAKEMIAQLNTMVAKWC